MAQGNKLKHSTKEASFHLVRHMGTTVCAVVSICLSLLITGMFAVSSISIRSMLDNVEESIVIRAFVDDAAEQQNLDAFQKEAESWPEVESVTFTTKDQALEAYRANMGDQGTQDAIDALEGQNPLPASFKLTPTDPDNAAQLAEKVKKTESFAKVADGLVDGKGDTESNVSYGQDTVDRLLSVAGIVQTGAIVAIAVLTIIAFTFINNTIRMSIASRDKEIKIQRLVGASNGFIRGPFIAEGAMQTIIGTIIAILALEVVRRTLFPLIATQLPFLKFDVPLPVYLLIYLGMLLLGLLVGIVSSVIAIRRFLTE